MMPYTSLKDKNAEWSIGDFLNGYGNERRRRRAMRSVEMNSTYFKSGDDLAWHLDRQKNPVKALYAWADQIEAGAKAIREIAKHIEGSTVEIQADTHMVIFNDVDDRIADNLIAKDLVREFDWDEEEDEGE